MWKPIKPHKQTNEQITKHLSNSDMLNKILKKLKLVIPEKVLNNNATIYMNPCFQTFISYLLTNESNIEIATKIIKSIPKINSRRLREISYLILLPIVNINDIDQFLENVNLLDKSITKESSPLLLGLKMDS